jgi:hypothetical protein
MPPLTAWVRAIVTASLLLVTTSHGRAEEYDLVITNGRVLDPESNLDGVRNLGIRGDTIQAIATERLRGRTPGASPWEIQEALRIAARYSAPSMVHLRYQ